MNSLTALTTYLCRVACSDGRGQDLIEYALLGSLVALAIMGVGLLVFSDSLTSLFNGIGACIDFKSSTPCGV